MSPAAASSGSEHVGDEIVAIGSALATSQYRLIDLAARFEAGDEWLIDGYPTAAHWIADRLDMCVSTAREWIRVGKALEALPAMKGAFAEGEISYAKVKILTRVATPENEAELLDIARRVPAGRLSLALAAWSEENEDPDVRAERHRRHRHLRWWTEPDGMIAGSFRLRPADAAGLTAGVDARVMQRCLNGQSRSVNNGRTRSGRDAPEGAWPSLAQQRADALVDLVTNGGAGAMTEVVIHVRGDGLAYDDGTPVAETVVERLVPDSFLRALIHDAEGRPINASSRRRHPKVRQKRVVKERDRVCSDCGSSDLLEYDHEPPYETTGHTVVEELKLRCAPCHHKRHQTEDDRAV